MEPNGNEAEALYREEERSVARAEDGIVLEDAQSGVPNAPDCRLIVTTFHCMYIRTTQATKRSERPPLGPANCITDSLHGQQGHDASPVAESRQKIVILVIIHIQYFTILEASKSFFG